MKYLLIILPLVFCTLSLHAEHTTEKNKTTGSKDVKKKTEEPKVVDSNDETFHLKEQKTTEMDLIIESPKPTKKESDVDSSYYSVNKFNYLFYFMYKVNYLMEGDDTP
ncbi:MAG: hypothetical protein OCD76_09215 [Reichenbachiella sp.]